MPKQQTKAVRGDQFYPSPIEAFLGLFHAEADHLPARLWEPACGDGALVTPLRATGRTVYATDLVARGCPDSVGCVDFLLERAPPGPIDGIVTNPPYGGLADLFIDRALELAPYVAMLLPLTRLAGGARRAALEASPLAMVHIFSSRLPRMHRGGYEGTTAPSQVTYAWFVWDRGRGAVRQFSWIGREHLQAVRTVYEARQGAGDE